MALGKNVKKQRELLGLSQNELSIRTGERVSQGAISALEKRDSKSSEFTAILAEALGVSVEFLLGKSLATNQNVVEYNLDLNQKTLDKCPVISWVKAGKLCELDEVLDYESAEEWRYCPVKHSSKTYVLIVSGESMAPDYPDGSEIFVDPTIEPINNDDVVVSTVDNKATFKRLQITHEGKHLLALNPNWPNRIIEVTEGTTICGVVIYSGQKRR